MKLGQIPAESKDLTHSSPTCSKSQQTELVGVGNQNQKINSKSAKTEIKLNLKSSKTNIKVDR